MGSLDVLVISVEAGAGHGRAAQALASALLSRGIKAKVEDAFAYGPSWTFTTVIGAYLKMLRWAPGFYRFLYQTAEKPAAGSLGKNLLTAYLKALLGPGLRKLISQTKPNVIVCTHPFPLGILCSFQDEGWLGSKLAGVVTDFTVHPFWAFSGCNRYYLAVPELINELIASGEEPGKGLVTGIPIDGAFTAASKMSRQQAEKELGLAPSNNRILIMGGSLGLGPLEAIVKGLVSLPIEALQLVVVAGKNQAVEESLKGLNVPHDRLVIFGFTQEVPKLMACSDLLCTKPGGLSSSEALAMGLPQLLFPPLPGHEEQNYRYLVNQGVASSGDNLESLVKKAVTMLTDPDEKLAYRQAARRIGNVNAAELVAEDIQRLLIEPTNN